MSKELVVIVDEDDQILEVKPRDDITAEDIVRVSVLWVENGKGEVLLQQRALTKKNGPGRWGTAVAGTVESHETYLSNIIKEAEEEIGLTNFIPIEVGKRMYREPTGLYARMFMFYKVVADKRVEEFTCQPDEVAQVAWRLKPQIMTEVKKNPQHYVSSATLWKAMYY